MESLFGLISSGVLMLACPSCGKSCFQESGLGCRLLHCGRCFKHIPVAEWVVQKVARVGDDDPHIHLRIERKDSGFLVQVNTDTRCSLYAEAVRFCTVSGGGRSLCVLSKLTEIAYSRRNGNRPSIRFHGQGGHLKIYQGLGDPDIWLKTENVEEEIFYGAEVFFPKEHEATPYIEALIGCMLEDMKARPIPLT